MVYRVPGSKCAVLSTLTHLVVCVYVSVIFYVIHYTSDNLNYIKWM
jgi:hypothetical protein